jgi:hypothetical protein
VVSESASPPLETPDVLVEPAQEPDDRHGRVRSSRT